MSNERNFTCQFNRENWIDTFGKGLPIKGYKMGGISGGPAFLYKISESGLLSLDLAGVIYEATSAFGDDLLIMSHSSFICSDGNLINPEVLPRKV